jgi:hypothetical protein
MARLETIVLEARRRLSLEAALGGWVTRPHGSGPESDNGVQTLVYPTSAMMRSGHLNYALRRGRCWATEAGHHLGPLRILR